MNDKIDLSGFTDRLRDTVDESQCNFPAVEERLFQMELEAKRKKRSPLGYLADKWIDLVALALAVIAFIRTL